MNHWMQYCNYCRSAFLSVQNCIILDVVTKWILLLLLTFYHFFQFFFFFCLRSFSISRYYYMCLILNLASLIVVYGNNESEAISLCPYFIDNHHGSLQTTTIPVEKWVITQYFVTTAFVSHIINYFVLSLVGLNHNNDSNIICRK